MISKLIDLFRQTTRAETGRTPIHVAGVARSPHWPIVRAAHLKRNPVCAACGRTKELEVHHILPYHLAPHLELEAGNLLTLCDGSTRCHWLVGHAGWSWEHYTPDPQRIAEVYGTLLRELRDRAQTRMPRHVPPRGGSGTAPPRGTGTQANTERLYRPDPPWPDVGP